MVDIVNFFLIWITLAMALAWPFQLFLFSYIVLGPLHYLTEINWLEKQNYFLRSQDKRVFVWSMAILVLILSVCVTLPTTASWERTQPFFDTYLKSPDSPARKVIGWSWTLMVVSFVTAAAWLFTERWLIRGAIIIFCLVSTAFFYAMPPVAIIFGILLPTIGHVFFFTFCFMFLGTLKTRSGWGYLNLVSMVAAVVVIALYPMVVHLNSLSDSVVELTFASAFQQVNFVINKWLGTIQPGQNIDLYSPAFFKVQAFIAFAYTYHYLNWFSKTSIIRWHKVPKKKFIFSAVLWVASIALYKVDYRLGFAAISALSVLHVVLEFPLNFVSFRAIFHAVTGRKLKTA